MRSGAIRKWVHLVAHATLLVLVGTGSVRAAGADVDSLGAPRAKGSRAPVDTVSLRVIPKQRYLLRHAFSFDQYLETQSDLLLVRSGPIGVDAFVSRYGIGRGRAMVTIDGVPFNDPQDGRAPLVNVPTSAIGTLEIEPAGIGYASGVEGLIAINAPDRPLQRPTTFFELSKGTNELRQRRARYSSIDGPIGIDVAYDEVLNDGYSFEGAGALPNPLATNNRNVAMNLRGRLDGGERYGFSLRRFEGSTREPGFHRVDPYRRNGQIATLSAGVGGADIIVYGRSHDLSTPDSTTANQSNGAVFKWRNTNLGGLEVSVGATAEDIDANQSVAGNTSRHRVTLATGELAATRHLGSDVRVTARGSFGGYTKYRSGWGVGAELARSFGRSEVAASARRRFRLPTMAEMFLPYHLIDGGVTISGNDAVEVEHAWEVGGRARLAFGPVVSETRLCSITVENPVAFRPTPVGNLLWRVARAGEAESIAIVDQHLSVDGRVGTFSLLFNGGVSYASGDRTGFFASTPEIRSTAELRVGSTLFEATSALFASAEVVHTSARRDFTNLEMPAYSVLNLKIDGHLLDARMYLVWFNILGEKYTTQGQYIMTPRTFVYGIVWTLFE